ncbi:sensor histidine kinase [Plantactinospora soyae]|uniref:histidine kinase n=1 Tax=Plantactinospora soyae TaxID=1544732 RepID=A0A927MJB4_9ACTN|nr:histidine kinase [Plantactinospora soyae]MBE1492220.1 signal transduction histidine kinase [Plantactinospora soyae]
MSRLDGRWGRPWRATTYLLGTLSTAVVTVFALPLLCHPALGRPWAQWHRHRAAHLLDAPVTPSVTPVRRYPRWLLVHAATGVPLGLVALLCMGNALLAVVVTPLWWAFPPGDPPRLLIEVPVTGWGTALVLGLTQLLVLVAVAYWILPPLARAHARIGLAVLAPSAVERLADRVTVLTRTRADVLEAHGAELRRIERDLHDGTQARLVGIAVRLALVREALPDSSPFVAKLLREAHEGTEEAMTELRDVIRTIYPAILSDRGLAGALTAAAARSGVPTRVDLDDLGQVPAAVEAVAYFVVTEALANVARHGRATDVRVRVRRTGDRLSVTVSDDGAGGADERIGTGLAGIRRRAQALDGTATVTSPAGGPTEICVELPCGW